MTQSTGPPHLGWRITGVVVASLVAAPLVGAPAIVGWIFLLLVGAFSDCSGGC